MSASTYTNLVDLTRLDLKCEALDAAASRLARKRGISEGEFVASHLEPETGDAPAPVLSLPKGPKGNKNRKSG